MGPPLSRSLPGRYGVEWREGRTRGGGVKPGVAESAVPPRAVRGLVRSLRRQWHLWRKRGVPLVYDPATGSPWWACASSRAWRERPDRPGGGGPAETRHRFRTAARFVREPAAGAQRGLSRAPARSCDPHADPGRAGAAPRGGGDARVAAPDGGGTIHATRLALRTGSVAVHLGGGFHHAMPEDGHGFCVFNDVAVAIARLRSRGYTRRILVVDLDLHDGNGRAPSSARTRVFTPSPSTTSIGEPRRLSPPRRSRSARRRGRALPRNAARGAAPVLEQVRPRLVYYVAGSDLAADDALVTGA